MGQGTWSASSYAAGTAHKIRSGTTFGYSRTTASRGAAFYKAHEDLDPTKKNAAGINIREARDNDDSPNSIPIVVAVDETGSMGSTPVNFQKSLTGLFGLLTRKGYVEDPQISIAAYGDAYSDRAPLQISQFEADNRVDTALDNLFIEGNGGGNGGETASLLWYYLVHHTATDAWEKRGKKGYFFFVADEKALDLEPNQVKKFIGVDEPQGDLTAEGLATELTKKWDVFVLLIDNMSAQIQGSKQQYETLFGADHVIVVENDRTIAETIGAALGRLENDDLDDEDIIKDMLEVGASKDVAVRATNAISRVRGKSGTVATSNGDISLDAGAANLL